MPAQSDLQVSVATGPGPGAWASEPTIGALAAVTPLAVNPSTIALSAPTLIDLEVYRGDSGAFKVTVTDAVGVAVNVTGATWDADIREVADDASPVAQLTCTPVSGDPSSVTVKLTPVESAKLVKDTYVYDVQMTLNTEVQTLVAGSIRVTKDVSRTP
jgi:hypothetical protein